MTKLVDVAGLGAVAVQADDPVIACADDFREVVGDAIEKGASMIVVPVDRLDAAFFDLRSGLAGEVLQKAVNYRLKLAIVGDISPFVASSSAFRDLVRESDRGTDVVFAASTAGLEESLSSRPASHGP